MTGRFTMVMAVWPVLASVANGHDPQFERAVQITLEALKKNPVVIPDRPHYPGYQKK